MHVSNQYTLLILSMGLALATDAAVACGTCEQNEPPAETKAPAPAATAVLSLPPPLLPIERWLNKNKDVSSNHLPAEDELIAIKSDAGGVATGICHSVTASMCPSMGQQYAVNFYPLRFDGQRELFWRTEMLQEWDLGGGGRAPLLGRVVEEYAFRGRMYRKGTRCEIVLSKSTYTIATVAAVFSNGVVRVEGTNKEGNPAYFDIALTERVRVIDAVGATFVSSAP